jgi:hypothetical protein
MQESSWHSVMTAPLNGSWGCIISFVILFILVAGGIASVPLYMHRKAVRDSRRVGAPDTRQTATFRGGMWWPGKFQAGPGTMSLDFFDWGIRLCDRDWSRFFSPVWEARYEELTEARLVKAPTQQGIRFHAGDGEGEVFFWTWGGSEVLDRLEEHVVAVDRTADWVPDPPPIDSKSERSAGAAAGNAASLSRAAWRSITSRQFLGCGPALSVAVPARSRERSTYPPSRVCRSAR